MPKKPIILLSVLFAVSVQFAVPDDVISPERPVSVEDTVRLGELIQMAFENNPDIQAAKAKWAQVIERYPQETALDDPALNFSYYVENVETRVGPQNYSAGISQKFPFPGTLRQKGRVVEKEIEIASLEYEKTVRDVVAELKQVVYELQYLDGAVEITRKNQTLLKEILSYTQTQYTDRKASLNDVFRAESQLAQLDYDLITIQELRAVQQSVINAISNRPSDASIGSIVSPIPKEATLTIEDLDRFAQARNQEIRLAQLGVEKSDETICLARKRNLPTFSIGVNYIDTGHAVNPGTPESGKDAVIIGGGMSIPLWPGKNKARVRYAEQVKIAAGQQQISVSNKIKVDVRKTFFKWQNARRLMVLYRDHLIPQAEQSMHIAEEWNRTGEGNFSEILEVQSVWLNFNLAWLRAQIDYAQSWTQLERLAGGSLVPGTEMEQ